MAKSDVGAQSDQFPHLRRRGTQRRPLRLKNTEAQAESGTTDPRGPEVSKDPRVAKVIALMKENIRRELSLGHMAQSVNLSPTHFSYLFRSEMGLPPARYLRILRMHEAVVLLSTTFLSIKQVVAQVGFSDASHFVRDFKRMFGTGPTAFRNQKFEVPPVQIQVINENRKIG